MNTQIDHARMRIKTNIRGDHDVRKYVPEWRTNMRYQETWLVNNE